jgi:cyclopropane-fatty-acyl-phospholipid synthase
MSTSGNQVRVAPTPSDPRRAAAARGTVPFLVRHLPVRFTTPDGTAFGAGDANSPRLEIRRPDEFWRRIGADLMIGFGESYMTHAWEPGPGTDLADLLTPFSKQLATLVPRPLRVLRGHLLPALAAYRGNDLAGARSNIAAHYDLSNEMFATFLDPSLMYSSALFENLTPPPSFDDLETAQLRKVDAILDAVGIGVGSRLLEIGSGWGTLAIRAAQRGADVTTITLSSEQADLARKRVADAGVADRVDVAIRDYREQAGRFDAVVSVEMIEAVGERYLPSYLRVIDRLLVRHGRAVVQAILMDHERYLETRATYGWIHKYIFPGGLIFSPEAIDAVLESETTLRVTKRMLFGQHYAETLRLWRERFNQNWAEASALGFNDTFRRMWEFYLAYCQAGFRTGYLNVAQLTLER